MTYTEAVSWLNALIDYEKAPDFRYPEVFKLDRVRALMSALGNPERAWPSIHIAGTKGKGTVATFVDALLRAHGCRTGLYTSPHLVSFRERVRIDGVCVSEDAFADSMSRLVPHAERWQTEHPDERLSFFDVLTTSGFDIFRAAAVEWGVVEVGMGGRLDATNVITPRVAQITPIALEHTKYLGDTIEAIAREKAGVMKPGVPVLIQRQLPEVESVLLEHAAEVGAIPYRIDDAMSITDSRDGATWTLRVIAPSDTHPALYEHLRLGALGDHQRRNFAAAVVVLHLAGVPLDSDRVRNVAATTTIPGRLQLIPETPPILLDVAHTPDSARMLVDAIRTRFSGRRTTLVFSCAQDKRVAEIAKILAPIAERVVLVPIPGIRAMSMEDMTAAWKAVHPFVTASASTREAIENARDTTPNHGLIIVTGSFVLVGAAMEALGINPT